MTEPAKKSNIKKRMFFDSFAVFFIALTPFLYKIYDYLPTGDENTSVSFLGLTIGSNGFVDVSTYVWFLSGKIIPFILLIIWFFTSRDWWYHILIIPIAMYAFQLFEAFYSQDDIVDTENIWWLLPICMVVIPFVYFIRIKLYDKYVHGIDLEAMEAELESIKKKQANRLTVEKENNKEIKENHYEYKTLTERLEYGLSTQNIENYFKRFLDNLRSLLHLRF